MLSVSAFERYLYERGWQGSGFSFTKDRLEIWRDTSSWVEVYKTDDPNKRLLDHCVETEENLRKLLDLLESHYNV